MDTFQFDFRKCEHFFTRINNDFDFSSLDNCKVYLVGESCFDNYGECVENGVLKEALRNDSVNMTLPLVLEEYDYDASVKVIDDTSMTIPENTSVAVKGVFITSPNNFVIFYSINTYSVSTTENILFEKDTVIWSDSEVRGNGIF